MGIQKQHSFEEDDYSLVKKSRNVVDDAFVVKVSSDNDFQAMNIVKAAASDPCKMPDDLDLMETYDEEEYEKKLHRVLAFKIETLARFVIYYRRFGDQMTTRHKEQTLANAAKPFEYNEKCLCTDTWEPYIEELLDYTELYIAERARLKKDENHEEEILGECEYMDVADVLLVCMWEDKENDKTMKKDVTIPGNKNDIENL